VNNDILVRYGEPSKYDHGPYGAICKVIKAATEQFDIYVQLSQHESNPQWHFVGAFAIAPDDVIIQRVQELLNK
jgi:hypothetical protein